MIKPIKILALIFCLISLYQTATAQEDPYIYGKVTNLVGSPLPGVNVTTNIQGVYGTITDINGYYKIYVPAQTYITLKFTYVGFKNEQTIMWLEYGQLREVNIMLKGDDVLLKSAIVRQGRRRSSSIIALDRRSLQQIPNPSGSITGLLRTLPGVVANNELSSQYSVRGGNFDENLIYVNDFEVYRPFLVRSGQQEGLSFINPDLVRSISFSAGGFEAKYGDKMSSVLDVKYKKPTSFGGSVSLSLLGANAHLEGANKDTSFTYIMGLRQQSNQYLLNALPTKGQYRPSSTDFQTFITARLSKRWEMEFIGNYGRNVFEYIPVESETSFGTFNEALQLNVYFDGQERDRYSTLMGGLGAIYTTPYNRLKLKFLTSGFKTSEVEAFDIIGQYWIGEVEKSLGEEGFGDVKRILGVGTYHDWARNQLNANIFNFSHKGYLDLTAFDHFLTWGAKYQHEKIDDQINEWYRLDSAGYAVPYAGYEVQFADVLNADLNLSSNRLTGFVQDEWEVGKEGRLNITSGIRFNYWDLNNEFVVTPRVQMGWQPKLKAANDSTKSARDLIVRFAAGTYYQPAFYREMRNSNGELNTNLKAQKSLHLVVGSDYTFKMWQRPFKLTTEVYYKQLWDLVPYDLENVLIRYFGQNEAVGYAGGLDVRLNGEFVKGTDSWISLSVMQTKENLKNDFYYDFFNEAGEKIVIGQTSDILAVDSVRNEVGFVPRPTDQRFNLGLFFQDYWPTNENFKMHLNMLIGSGLPFSPSQKAKVRNSFRVPPYRRIDIGFSAQLFDSSKKELPEFSVLRKVNTVWASLEIFNLLGVSNTISYTWLQAQNRVYGIPNYLTARRVNARLIVKF